MNIKELKRLSEAYRAGQPEVSDAEYDYMYKEAKEEFPDDEFFKVPEPEVLDIKNRQKVEHRVPMLSLDKVYHNKDVRFFMQRIEKIMGAGQTQYLLSAKLDGLAASYDAEKKQLLTRGDGIKGYDISDAIGRVRILKEESGTGEIVVNQYYFNKVLSSLYAHPRNFCVGVVNSNYMDMAMEEATSKGHVHFVLHRDLYTEDIEETATSEAIDFAKKEIADKINYAIDGFVLEAHAFDIAAKVGSTSHHPKWMIALKENGESADTIIERVDWQVGRGGRITPVARINTINLSGANINNVTLHNAGMVRDRMLGAGAKVSILRSGEIIPFLKEVLIPAVSTNIPTECPWCGHDVRWEKDLLFCASSNCTAQRVGKLRHFLLTVGVRGAGLDFIKKVYGNSSALPISGFLKKDIFDLEEVGVSKKIGNKILDEIDRVRNEPIAGYVLLAAFGIHYLGRGDSKRFLNAVPYLEMLGGKIDYKKIRKTLLGTNGFAETKVNSIISDLSEMEEELAQVVAMFNVQGMETPPPLDGYFFGKKLVFTGTMKSKTRKEFEAEAIAAGATVQKKVNAKTDYLIAGEKAGSKLKSAINLGVPVLTEEEYGEKF